MFESFTSFFSNVNLDLARAKELFTDKLVGQNKYSFSNNKTGYTYVIIIDNIRTRECTVIFLGLLNITFSMLK